MNKYDESANYLKSRLEEAGIVPPDTAVILGSGLGHLVDRMEVQMAIPYTDIPHFKASTALGHAGRMIFGTLGGRMVLAMQGRFHYYEGYTMEEVTFPVRVFALMGVKRLLVSNAAGAVNPSYAVGDLMVITDHINMMPNPLVGKNDDRFGPRFPDMTEVYSVRLRALADEQANRLGIKLQHGVYVAGTGPSYETPAEYHMYRVMGADACGMSTVPEVIVARHAGLEVFSMSVITNQPAIKGSFNDGDDVVRQAELASGRMGDLFTEIIRN